MSYKKSSLYTIKEGFYYEELPHSHPVKGRKILRRNKAIKESGVDDE